MFGKKKSHEIEENENRNRKLLSLSERTCSDLLLDVDQISVQAFSEGEHLKESLPNLTQAKEDQEQAKGILLSVKDEMITLTMDNEERQEALKKAAEGLDQDQKDITELIENGRHSTEITTNLTESTETVMKYASQMTETAEQMEVLGRNMSVLALNSAIEAGRLGPGSERYVTAAEQVRVQAENYGAAAQEISEGLKEMKESLDLLRESVSRVSEYYKKNSILLGKALTRVTEDAQDAMKASKEELAVSEEDLTEEMNNLMALREETSAMLEMLSQDADKTRDALQEVRGSCQTMEDRIKKLQGAFSEDSENMD